MKLPTRSNAKLKFISIFISTAITGVVLISFAVYNTSQEMQITHQISNLYTTGAYGTEQFLSQHNNRYSIDDLAAFAATFSSPDQHSRVLNSLNFAPFRWEQHQLDIHLRRLTSTRTHDRGGYFFAQNRVYTWVQIPIGNSAYSLFRIQVAPPLTLASLYQLYANRLLVPAAFYRWLTVWGSFILNNLISRLQAQKDAVERMALHDSLTGLANRNLFSEKSESLWQYSRREGLAFSLVLLDLDKFKQVNDTLGHDYGDELLRQVARRLEKAVRKYDTIARVGGDEFVLLLPNTDHHNYRPICDRILHDLVQDYDLFQTTVQIGASLGIAIYPNHAEELVELTRKADRAMYTAKKRGGGVFCFQEAAPITHLNHG